MARKKLLFICFSILLCIQSSHAGGFRYSVRTLDDTKIAELKNWIDKDTIVFITTDKTISTTESQLFAKGSFYRYILTNMQRQAKKRSKYYQYLINFYNKRRLRLIEDKWSDFIYNIKEKEALVYGLSTPPFKIKNIQNKQYKELADLGVTFSTKVNDQEYFAITQTNKKKVDLDKEWIPFFYK